MIFSVTVRLLSHLNTKIEKEREREKKRKEEITFHRLIPEVDSQEILLSRKILAFIFLLTSIRGEI